MSETSANNKRIAKNTLMLYIRMLFSMFVSFYTSRVVLATLGETDFGINNVVGGVAAMFSFLNSSMAGATSRFLTFTLGQNDIQKLKNTFAAALTIHTVLAVIIFLLCETIGLWLLETQLVIPPDRMAAARVIFQFAVITTMLGIMQVPFSSAVIAHERMDVFAYFGIADVIIKLIIVYVLTIIDYDKLILYSSLFFAVSLVMLIVHRWYDVTHFEECSFRMSKDREFILPMLKFSGWDLFGNLSLMGRTQGVNILQNMFWGPGVNAATGIANQVMTAVLGFSNNFMTAVRPQIVKTYAQGNIAEMQKLAERSSKFSFFLLFFISFPLFLEAPFVLNLWLKQVPDYTVAFVRLSIIFNWNVTTFLPLMHIIHATGNVKRISLINGALYLLVVPVTWVLFKFGYSPTTPFLLNACFVLLGAGLSNLYTVKLYIHEFKSLHFLRSTVVRILTAISVGAALPTCIYLLLPSCWTSFVSVCLACAVAVGLSIFFIGMDEGERGSAISLIRKKLHIN